MSYIKSNLLYSNCTHNHYLDIKSIAHLDLKPITHIDIKSFSPLIEVPLRGYILTDAVHPNHILLSNFLTLSTAIFAIMAICSIGKPAFIILTIISTFPSSRPSALA